MKRLVPFGLAIAAAFAAVTLSGVGPADLKQWVADAGAAAPIVFVGVGALLGLALFPGHVTATLAGLLFGALGGTAVAIAAALIGAVLAMLVARVVGADAVLSLLGERGRKWRDFVQQNGFSAVLACRLAPGMPSGIVNYLAGLVGIRLRAFAAAVSLGALPKTIAYVALGGALADPLSARGATALALYAVTAAVGALVARRLVRQHRLTASP
ncbi:MAG TPA: TVP38/TMEM64 family protein [Solirubrobacter sp.]|nr:TVP38/TMEM64 family protein [Solirubrobacter sp.]